MTTAVLVSDIHGNAPALRRVVASEGTDPLYFILGDIHGLYGYPEQVVNIVRRVGTHVIAGNHDKAIFQYNEGHVNSDALSTFEYEHTMAELSESQQEYMESLPYFQIATINGSRICLTHAQPWPENASGYEPGNAGIQKRDVMEIAAVVSDDYDYVFHGHTHTQYQLDCSQFAGNHTITFVNPGSVGQYGEYAVVDIETGDVALKSVSGHENKVKAHLESIVPDTAPDVDTWY
jgi:predicted phosphodiesterase